MDQYLIYNKALEHLVSNHPDSAAELEKLLEKQRTEYAKKHSMDNKDNLKTKPSTISTQKSSIQAAAATSTNAASSLKRRASDPVSPNTIASSMPALKKTKLLPSNNNTSNNNHSMPSQQQPVLVAPQRMHTSPLPLRNGTAPLFKKNT